MADEKETVEFDTKALDKLTRALRGNLAKVRVGILQNNVARNGGTSASVADNATIGAFHEFGTTKLPMRSFLRVPIIENLEKKLTEAGAIDAATLKDVFSQVSLKPWLYKIAAMMEGIVLEAFATGGYGKWKPSDMTHKKNAQTLVETGQLRNSISSDVKD